MPPLPHLLHRQVATHRQVGVRRAAARACAREEAYLTATAWGAERIPTHVGALPHTAAEAACALRGAGPALGGQAICVEES